MQTPRAPESAHGATANSTPPVAEPVLQPGRDNARGGDRSDSDSTPAAPASEISEAAPSDADARAAQTGSALSSVAAANAGAESPAARVPPTRTPRSSAHAVHAGAASALLDPVDEHESESEGWLITYLDMITLLLVMMVVMLAFAGGLHGLGRSAVESVSTPAAVAPVQLPPLPLYTATSTATTASALALPVPDLGDDIEVLVNDRSISFRISSEILFDSGQADLSLGGLALLRRLLPVLRDSPHPVAVHGHTDPLPIRSARFPSNWELSSARAGSVVRYLEANGIDKQRLRAVGFADTRALSENESAAGRARNRRVELVLEQPGT